MDRCSCKGSGKLSCGCVNVCCCNNKFGKSDAGKQACDRNSGCQCSKTCANNASCKCNSKKSVN